jgi:hypothetical protein
VPDAEAIIKDRFRMILGYPSTIVADQTGHIVEVFQGAKLKTDPAVPVAAAVDGLLGGLLSKDKEKGHKSDLSFFLQKCHS